MERLTKNMPAVNFKAVPVNIALDFAFELDDDTWLGLQRIFDRLAEYEDTGYSPEDFDKLCREMSDLRMALCLDTYDDLRKIIQADRLLVLPCAIGTPVWVHEPLCSRGKQVTYEGCKFAQDCTRDRFIKCPLRVVKRAFTVNMRKGLGITFWLTKKEAEDAIPADRRP